MPPLFRRRETPQRGVTLSAAVRSAVQSAKQDPRNVAHDCDGQVGTGGSRRRVLAPLGSNVPHVHPSLQSMAVGTCGAVAAAEPLSRLRAEAESTLQGDKTGRSSHTSCKQHDITSSTSPGSRLATRHSPCSHDGKGEYGSRTQTDPPLPTLARQRRSPVPHSHDVKRSTSLEGVRCDNTHAYTSAVSGTNPHQPGPEGTESGAKFLAPLVTERSPSTIASTVSSPCSCHPSAASHVQHVISPSNSHVAATKWRDIISVAVKDAEMKLRVGNAAACIAAIQSGFRRANESEISDLLERAAVQLDSEVNEARNYAQRRDDEVYKLSVVRATLYGGIRHVI